MRRGETTGPPRWLAAQQSGFSYLAYQASRAWRARHRPARVGNVRLFRQDSKVEALAKAPLFEGLSKKELTQLARVTDDMQVEAGFVLCKEGQLGREFFVLMDGEVEISRRGRRVESRGGGDIFGEIALIADVPRTATVTAKTPLRFFVLTAQAFRPMLDDYPTIERKVLRAVAKRLASLSADPSLA